MRIQFHACAWEKIMERVTDTMTKHTPSGKVNFATEPPIHGKDEYNATVGHAGLCALPGSQDIIRKVLDRSKDSWRKQQARGYIWLPQSSQRIILLNLSTQTYTHSFLFESDRTSPFINMSTFMERTLQHFKAVEQKQNETLGPQDDESDVFLLSPTQFGRHRHKHAEHLSDHEFF
jgi:hypothetical protein